MTTTDAPTNFVEVNNGQSNNNNQNSNETVDLPNNITTQNEINIIDTPTMPENNEPIIINNAFTADVTYYLWVRDSNGSLSYQTFTISKAII